MTKWKLVPVEPTYQQWTLITNLIETGPPVDGDDAVGLYQRLLDAAPPPPIPPARLAEMREACNTYGPANCWTGTTGTLAAMVRELLELIGEARE